MQEQQGQQSQGTGAILKELSDIKASLAVNTNETANIKANISEIKGDIKDIKLESVGRREFNDAMGTLRSEIAAAKLALQEQVDPLRRFIYGIIAIVGATLIPSIINIVSKLKQ